MASSAAKPKDSKGAGHEHQVGGRKLLVDLVLFAKETARDPAAFFDHHPLGARAVRSVAHQHEFCRNLLLNAVENLDHIRHALHRAEI